MTGSDRHAEGRAWAEELRGELSSGWPRWASFACMWLWTCLSGKTVIAQAPAQLGGILAVPTALVLAANVATLLALVVASGRIATVVGSRRLMGLAGVLLTAGSAGLALAAYGLGLPAFAVGSCASGAAIGLLKVAWGEMFSRMSLRAGLIDMGLALATSTLAFFALSLAPLVAQAVVLVALSPACAPLARRGTLLLEGAPEPSAPPGDAHRVTFGWTLLILPVLVGFTFGLFLGISGSESSLRPMTALIMTGAELVAGLLLLGASRLLSPGFGASQIYAAGLMFTVAGLALATTDAAPSWLPAGLDRLGFSVFYFFMIVYWGDVARRTGRPVVRTYVIGYATFQSSQLPGLVAGLTMGEGEASTLLPVAVVLAFFVVVLLVFSDPHSSLRQWLAAGESVEATDAVPEACARLAGACGLTPREREVLSLLARGRTAVYVGRALGIAPDTAKTHIRSIYRKLDVHTQQELIDLIAREGATR